MHFHAITKSPRSHTVASVQELDAQKERTRDVSKAECVEGYVSCVYERERILKYQIGAESLLLPLSPLTLHPMLKVYQLLVFSFFLKLQIRITFMSSSGDSMVLDKKNHP